MLKLLNQEVEKPNAFITEAKEVVYDTSSENQKVDAGNETVQLLDENEKASVQYQSEHGHEENKLLSEAHQKNDNKHNWETNVTVTNEYASDFVKPRVGRASNSFSEPNVVGSAKRSNVIKPNIKDLKMPLNLDLTYEGRNQNAPSQESNIYSGHFI